jgi:hypothetical protein
MDAVTLDTWVSFRNEGSVVRCRLFCFPHAAGSATFYRLMERLDQHLRMISICACARKLPHIFNLDFTNKILAGAPEAGRRATVAV